MTSLRDFIAARLDEDEAAARQTAAEGVDNVLWRVWAGALDARAYLREEGGTEEDYERMQKNQIARARTALALGDPDRALREVAAKRSVIRQHEDARDQARHPVSAENRMRARVAEGELLEVIQRFAAIYSSHPDYREEWAA